MNDLKKLQNMNDEELLRYILKLKNRDVLPYRQGVFGLVMDSESNFLIVQMVKYKDNEWNWLGGGVEENEDIEETLLRELKEELGSSSFKIMKKSTLINRFEWDNQMVVGQFHKRGQLYNGQEKVQFLVQFTGDKSELKSDPKELKQIAWVPREELKDYFIFDGQWEFAEKTLSDLLQEN